MKPQRSLITVSYAVLLLTGFFAFLLPTLTRLAGGFLSSRILLPSRVIGLLSFRRLSGSSTLSAAAVRILRGSLEYA